jgi:hypothetical protein
MKIFVVVTVISSVFIICETHTELLAKKSAGNKSGVNGGYEVASLPGNNTSAATSSNSSSSPSSGGNTSGGASNLNITQIDDTHCDKKGYPSCYDLGYSDGQNAPGTSCPSGHSEAYCSGYEAASLPGNNTSAATSSNSSSSPSSAGLGISEGNSQNTVAPIDDTHCDKKGYPSCYDLGYSEGQNAPGTSCPSGHSEAYCSGYDAASLSGNSSSPSSASSGGSSEGNSDLKNPVSPIDDTHCDKKGYPSCYDLGYSDGQNAPGTSCPSGHSEAYCSGYDAASLSGNSSSSPSFVTQNPKTKINQGAESNANINVSNSSGTRITNEQIIKQSVRINNEVNNLIRYNDVNKIVKENTVSPPQQPLTDLLTINLANSSMSSGALFPVADVEPYSVIGGHITANLPSSSQQNIVVAQISNGEIQHAVILDLVQITGSNLGQNSLFETSLGSDISGTNPFTGNSDEVSSITNLFLWNNNQKTIVFNNANGITMNLIYR